MIIRVIKYKGRWVATYQYSQGELSEYTVDNPLKALNLNKEPKTAKEFAERLYLKREAIIEEYEVTCKLLNPCVQKECTSEQPTEKPGSSGTSTTATVGEVVT
jgi:hypothetical protein